MEKLGQVRAIVYKNVYQACWLFVDSDIRAMLKEHVRLCYDTCHFAVEYEEPESVFAQLQAAGIPIGKISSVLHCKSHC
ncbi:hypothetical protein LC653_45145 [Nostoc sp. CHAB 5784]|uniref:hypothetical protein n=1 Tax=Nostoc mirabile TaxID=2907820 RepID=UPI001E6043A4|nr:hypothetical protein [Nostoc mirabile]MCC5670756.1 hypothetical protein [Nostoc mirabile CHAB5784]